MNLRIANSIRAVSALTLLASLTGCVIVDKNDTDPGTGPGTAGMSSTSGEGTTMPTTGSGTSGTSDGTVTDTAGATITTEVPTSTDASATGESTTAGSTTADLTSGESTGGDSTTGANPELQAACEAACAVFLECQPGVYPDLATCAAECLDGAPGGPKCEAAATQFNSCIGGFDCEQLNTALMTMEFGACMGAFNDYIANCNL